ncbi:MAG: CdaR family protein [Clostridiales bacterium]|nr:CdaR family protein [Clostridiales bacterium]
MFRSKKLNLLISFLIAIVLWAYVIGEVNPTITKSFADVKINLENQLSLEERGLAIESMSNDTLSLTVKGERSRVQNVSKEDIYADVDLTAARSGRNELDINVKTPEKVNVESRSVSKVGLTIGELVAEERPVKVAYVGATKDDTEPFTVKLEPEDVTIRGAYSNVQKVTQVLAKISVDEIKDKETTLEAELIPVDKNGSKVSWIRLSSSQVQVKAVMTKTKKVELEIPIQGENAADVKFDLPKTVIIKGNADVVKNISKIQTEPVDMSLYQQNMSFEVKPILPDGIQLAEGNDLTVKVTSRSSENKNITFEEKDIDVLGLEDNQKAKITDTVVISAEGSKDTLDDVKKEDFTVAIDVSGLLPGTHKVDVVVTNKKGFKKYTIKPTSVSVDIR